MSAGWWDLVTLLAVFIFIIVRLHIEALDAERDSFREHRRRNLGRSE